MALTTKKLQDLIDGGKIDIKTALIVDDYPEEHYAGQTIDRIVK
jgi:hypothetical protein